MLAEARRMLSPGDRTGERILADYEAALARPAPME
jgi:hypothetical protein